MNMSDQNQTNQSQNQTQHRREGRPISELMSTTLAKIKDMVDVNTIVGQPIETPDGVTLIPVSKLFFGFASGGSEFGKAPKTDGSNFGGGSGAGVKIDPVAFLVVRGESVRLLPVGDAPMTTADRIVDAAPEVVDKITSYLDKRKEKQEF